MGQMFFIDPRNLALCIMKSNETQSWAWRLHTSSPLPKRLYLLPLPTSFYTDLVLPWDRCHGIPGTALSAATLAGPWSSLCPFCEPSSELWGVRHMHPGVPTALILPAHLNMEIPCAWVLLCHARSLPRKGFPGWPQWILTFLECLAEQPFLSLHSHHRTQILVCLLEADATHILVHLRVRVSYMKGWGQSPPVSSGHIKPPGYYSVVSKTFWTSEWKKKNLYAE